MRLKSYLGEISGDENTLDEIDAFQHAAPQSLALLAPSPVARTMSSFINNFLTLSAVY